MVVATLSRKWRPTSLLTRILFIALLGGPNGTALAVEFDGFTEPFRRIEIAFVEPGVIARIAANEGDRVDKGQLLVELDNSVLKASLAVAKAKMEATGQVRSASALVGLRKSRLDTVLPLLAQGHARPEEVVRAESDLQVARANLAAARELQAISKLEYELIGTQIEQRRIKSPVKGIITRIHKEAAEPVFGRDTPLLTLAQLDPLRVTIHVPTTTAMSLQADSAIQVDFPEFDASTKGRIELISPVTDADSGTVRVKILIDNATGDFRSGVRCKVSFESKDGD